MQFSKAGLELPQSDRPFKRRASHNESFEPDAKETQSSERCVGHDSFQSFEEERVPVNTSISLGCSQELICGNRTDSVNEIHDSVSVKEVANEKSDTSMLGDAPQISFHDGSTSDKEIVKSTVCFVIVEILISNQHVVVYQLM